MKSALWYIYELDAEYGPHIITFDDEEKALKAKSDYIKRIAAGEVFTRVEFCEVLTDDFNLERID